MQSRKWNLLVILCKSKMAAIVKMIIFGISCKFSNVKLPPSESSRTGRRTGFTVFLMIIRKAEAQNEITDCTFDRANWKRYERHQTWAFKSSISSTSKSKLVGYLIQRRGKTAKNNVGAPAKCQPHRYAKEKLRFGRGGHICI